MLLNDHACKVSQILKLWSVQCAVKKNMKMEYGGLVGFQTPSQNHGNGSEFRSVVSTLRDRGGFGNCSLVASVMPLLSAAGSKVTVT